MTTLAKGRDEQLAFCRLESNLDKSAEEFRLKWRAQVLAISLGEHPYYCYLMMLECGFIKPGESLENHPYGWEICFWLWEPKDAENWTREWETCRWLWGKTGLEKKKEFQFEKAA